MYAEHLTHTCTIRRATATENELHETENEYADWDTEVDCLFMEKTEKVFDDDAGEFVHIPVTLLFFLNSQDAQESDQVTEIVIEDGEAVPGTFVIESLLKRRIPGEGAHHQTATVRKLP